ncbi:MAG: peptidase domain-containing protein [Methanoregula sp.]|jgi:hypothetical protein
MNLHRLHVIILIGAAVLVSGVTAQDVYYRPGYEVVPATDTMNLPVLIPLSAGTIMQGETDWYYHYIPSGTASLTTDLYWGDTSDSLSLTIIAPDGTLGPFYDSSDGVINGRITLSVSRAGGLPPGTWSFRVYGEKVTGSQVYNFFVY